MLLRGLGRSKEHWGDFLDRFRAALPGARVETPDLPGAGALHDTASPLSVPALLAAVRAELRADAACWVLGLSLGGMVAQEWLRAHPAELAGAVLVNTSAGGLGAPWRRVRPGAAWQIAAAMATRQSLPRERRIHALTSNHPDRAEAVAPLWAAIAQRQPVTRANVLRQLLAASRHRSTPGEAPGPPVLVLTSQRDRLVHPDCSRALAARLHATLHEHSSAGHDLPLDDPEWVLDRIRGWLGSLPPG
ncbi:MAG TPA: alpha/beta hydrolase [Polyangia bacterium]|nr:alpha/beta hydrolase [Polyangia bacterium]